MEKLYDGFYKSLLENIDLGIYFVDKDRGITFFNKKAEEITGYKAREVIGIRCVDDLFNHLDKYGNKLCLNGCPLKETINDGKIRQAEVFLHHKKGHRVPIRVSTSQIIDKYGNVLGAVETFKDISMEVEIEREKEDLKLLAMIDELTSLPNRRYLEEWIMAKHREFHKFGRKYGVLILDIDNFKNVNDTYGHLVGDEILKVVSKTIQSATRANDIASRFGGEEFVVVVSGTEIQKLHQIGKRMCSLIFNSTLEVGDCDLSVSVSIGGAIVNENDDIKSIMERADSYMYKAKSSGKSRVCTEYGVDIVERELNSSRQLHVKS